MGEVAGIRLIDDYAHHPSEVLTTLKAAAMEEAERLVCIFQPHRYSRTAALWEGFGSALLLADLVIVTDVYAAGEDPLPGVSGKLIVNALLDADPTKQVVYVPKRSQLGNAAASFPARGRPGPDHGSGGHNPVRRRDRRYPGPGERGGLRARGALRRGGYCGGSREA